MHNLKEIRKDFNNFKKSLEKRSIEIDISNLEKLDKKNVATFSKFVFDQNIKFWIKTKGIGTELNRNQKEPEPDRTGADRNRTEPNRTVGIMTLDRSATLGMDPPWS